MVCLRNMCMATLIKETMVIKNSYYYYYYNHHSHNHSSPSSQYQSSLPILLPSEDRETNDAARCGLNTELSVSGGDCSLCQPSTQIDFGSQPASYPVVDGCHFHDGKATRARNRLITEYIHASLYHCVVHSNMNKILLVYAHVARMGRCWCC